ncbi:protein REVEILLE 3 [Pyrus ussuriensis x Pyrus communis]|uniref:Protein REVEILLE 3 n=1 Tax=Pyrus ussuriensis x Pyrus communis TaxID=2448454 RepID=A0A5N5F6R7_9ROSA|nr:protein REVEILLE 3 [Pyrus ussuriensis x Pyrus communis]
MLSLNPNPAQGFYLFDPMITNMGLPGLNPMPPPTAGAASATAAASTTAACTSSSAPANAASMSADDQSKKIRKPYTITKSRESWTEQEHDKFLEALQLFDRDWKKIEAFIGSKTVIQIRSHAQKYFLKVQKKGTSEHVPPPRPKRKATHPYPQKAPKSAAVVSQVAGPFQSSSHLLEHGYVYQPDSSFVLGTPVHAATLSSWSYNSVPPVNVSQTIKDEGRLSGPTVIHNSCYSSSNESNPTNWKASETVDRVDPGQPHRVLPDFAQVYKFIGSVFDPSAVGHLERLRQLDPINFETALLLMQNLSINLTSPEFQDHRKLITSYAVGSNKTKSDGNCNFSRIGKSENAILSA